MDTTKLHDISQSDLIGEVFDFYKAKPAQGLLRSTIQFYLQEHYKLSPSEVEQVIDYSERVQLVEFGPGGFIILTEKGGQTIKWA